MPSSLSRHLSQKVAVFYPTHTEEQQVDNVGLEPVSMRQRRPLLTSDARKVIDVFNRSFILSNKRILKVLACLFDNINHRLRS